MQIDEAIDAVHELVWPLLDESFVKTTGHQFRLFCHRHSEELWVLGVKRDLIRQEYVGHSMCMRVAVSVMITPQIVVEILIVNNASQQTTSQIPVRRYSMTKEGLSVLVEELPCILKVLRVIDRQDSPLSIFQRYWLRFKYAL